MSLKFIVVVVVVVSTVVVVVVVVVVMSGYKGSGGKCFWGYSNPSITLGYFLKKTCSRSF